MTEYQCLMAKYVCPCSEHEESRDKASIKMVDGKVVHDVKCPCGKYMELKDPKSGAPSFRSNRYGQVY
jgi:hypothetical protein